MSSIVLIGFMGAGKTTVGKELVKKGFELIDTDAYIEACEKMSISDIFAQKGEDYFRQAETKALKTLLVQDKQFVISDRKSTRLNSSHPSSSRMPSSA